ncbi:MAG: hypothetical protein ABR538_10375 [Candidatus Binatia bacterium]
MKAGKNPDGPTADSNADAPASAAPAPTDLDDGRPRSLAGTKATERAFVIQLAADGDPAAADLRGRVQHLATSDGGNFGSVEGLVAIMRRVLERAAGKQRE